MQTRVAVLIAVISLLAVLRPNTALALGQASGSLGFVSTGGSVSLGFNVDLLRVSENIHLNAGIKYWQYSWEDPFAGSFSLTTRDIIFNPRVVYRYKLVGTRFQFFGASGAALHIIRVSGKETYGTPSSATATGPTFDINIGGGADYTVNERVAVGAELNIHTGGVSFTEFALRTSFHF